MTRTIHVLSPTDVKPGSITPTGRRIQKVTLYENPEKGVLIAGLEFDDGKIEALQWPLGYGWTVDGRTAPPRPPEEE